MNEFEAIIAAKKAEHERRQQVSPFINVAHSKVKTEAKLEKQVAAGRTGRRYHSDFDMMGRARMETLYEEDIKSNLNSAEYMRLGLVPYVLGSIGGWLTAHTCELLLKSHLVGQGTREIMQEMITSARFAYGRVSQQGGEFEALLKVIREVWMERGFSNHIKNLKTAYLNAIFNSKSRYDDANANDLMAWDYTAIDLLTMAADYLINGARQYNAETKGMKLPIPERKNCMGAQCIKTLTKWLRMCHFDPKLTSKDIELARKVVYNQMRLADIEGIFNEQKRLSEMEGKTVKIA